MVASGERRERGGGGGGGEEGENLTLWVAG